MTSFESLARGGVTGVPWVPGKPEDSLLVWYLHAQHGKQLMPQGGPALPTAQIALFENWISQGATDDTPASWHNTVATGTTKYHAPVPITAMAYSPDGTVLAVAGYREVLLHNPEGRGLADAPVVARPRLAGLSERIESILFSPDGNTLAVAGGSAGRFGELQLWNWRAAKLIHSVIPSHDTIYGASFSPDGRRVSFGCADNSARIIDADSGRQLLRIDHHEDWVFGTALSADNKHIVTAGRDRAVKLCESDTGSFIDNITTITPGLMGGGLRGLIRRPGHEHYLTAGEDGIPKLYQMIRTKARKIGDDDNLIRRLAPLGQRVEALTFSADGRWAAAGGVAGAVKVFAVDDGSLVADIRLPSEGPVFALAFRPDLPHLAVAGHDGRVRIFSLPEGQLLTEFVPVPLTAPALSAH